MNSEFVRRKRLFEETLPSSKHLRLESPLSENNYLNMVFKLEPVDDDDLSCSSVLDASETPENIEIATACNNIPISNFPSAQNFLDTFCKDLETYDFIDISHQHTKTSCFTEQLQELSNINKLENIASISDNSTTSMLTSDEIKREPSSDMCTSCNDLLTFFDSEEELLPAKEDLKEYFLDSNLQNLEFSPNLTNDSTTEINMEALNNQSFEFSKILSPSTINDSLPHVAEMRDVSSNTHVTESTTSSFPNKTTKFSRLIIFQKDLGDSTILISYYYNRRYNIRISQYESNKLSDLIISMKNGILMDVNSWYEFQLKLFAFNLKYKSSSFVANNNILVLNENNSIMNIKNLTNHSHIELRDFQLQNLKETTSDFNKSLISHMFSKQLPNLIKHKASIGNLSREKELALLPKLILVVEENLVTILNRIYECSSCAQSIVSKSLHICFLFNNREKFQQMGSMLFMLLDLDFIASTFLNRVDYVSEYFLCNINLETIENDLFKAVK